MTTEEMAERVQYCLNEKMYKGDAYALRRVLGDLDSSADDDKTLGSWRSLGNVFKDIVHDLRQSTGKKNYRQILVEGDGAKIRHHNEIASDDTDKNVELLYAQAQQLMDEVRIYDKRRDLALARLEALMVEIQQRKDCPEYFGKDHIESALPAQEIDVDGSIMQIRWPYRSIGILQKLRLTTVNEAVEHFQDFNNFVKGGGDITLLEWSVITSILRKTGLLSAQDYYVVELSEDIGALDLSVRTYNCLRRRGIDNFMELIMIFAGGALEGWDEIGRIRNLGRKSYEEIIRQMNEFKIGLDDMLCFPTADSEVFALDFGWDDYCKTVRYGLKTISDLLSACRDENRFTGLRYVDDNLYQAAMDRFKAYGYNI